MKTKIKFFGFFTILMTFLLLSLSVNAQIHEKLERSGNYTFKQIVNQSEQHFDRIGRGKGVGYKQFQRWKYWAERNLDDNGKVRNTMQALQSYKKFSKESKATQSKSSGDAKIAAARSFATSYVELGPLTSVYTSTWSSGLGRVSAIGLDPNNDNHIIVGSPTGGIWKTTNLGGTWTPLFDDQANIDVYALEISHSNSNHYWAGLNGGLVRSTDGGLNWSNVGGIASDLYNTITMHPTDANILFAIGQSRDRVYRSTDGGASFSVVADVSLDLYDLEFHPTNPNIVYASGNNTVLISTDGGASFSQITSGPWSGNSNTLMMAVTPAAPNNLYVLQEQSGGFNALYLSQDTGSTWTTLDSYDGTNNIMGYDQDVQSGQAPRDMDVIVSPVNANIIHVAGVETWRSNDLGQNWTKTTRWNAPGASDFIHADIDLLIYDGNRIVAGTDGGIFYSTDEANNWTDISAGLAIRQFYRIGASETDADRVSGGSQDNGTGTLVSGTWRDWLGADGMETFIDWNNADIIYGTSQNGTFYKSIDGGNSRTSISNSPPNGNWVTPFEQDPVNPSTIYASADQVYKSTNGGGSWSTISNFSSGNADEMKISPVDPNYIYVSYGATLYTTTDGGSNWTTRSIPAGSRINYITVHPTDASRLAIAVSGSSNKLHESMDGGATWTNITGNIPSSVSIECVLYDEASDGGFYAGGNPGIYYTSNSTTASYTDVTQNLPKVRITELEIRNQVLYVGTYGRGLWKYEFGCDGSLTGQACNDFDACTENDVYDANCDCAGTPVVDSDNDGVCDTVDQCPGFDDNIDIDQDGIPDACDSNVDCNSCETVISTFPDVEDFESGTNGICQFGSDDLDWTVNIGSTGSTGTGPSGAHSGSNYFYVEASDPNFPTKVAKFKGSCFDVSGASAASIDFWYHMYGGSVNELKLDISTDGGANYTTVWTQTGNKGDVWLNANVDLTAYIGSELTYTFTVTTGTSWNSDIAVDLITVDASFGACAANGGDADGDGICADVDCDDDDPNIGSEGMTCDDGDDCTENDVLDADCNCAGTLIETDTDNDGVIDCDDQEINSPCPLDVDANGISNDNDNDGVPNCSDNCPDDPDKTEPGDCGCGVAEIDADGDGILDCNDQELNSPCPLDVDANGVSNDNDSDGIPNCNDNCPDDPGKTEPGDCGCGVAEIDADGDGVLDCNDSEINSPCPLDVDDNGVSVDTDGDGILNCNDLEVNSSCPQDVDANGISNDNDNDGTPNCLDNCDNDPNKTEPGDCGCGVSEADTDGDGVLDCNDQEINSPCPIDVDVNGVSNDVDNDGIPNCNDSCNNNLDSDGDGIFDCDDQEINSPCPLDVDANGVSNDNDNDGTPNCSDNCPDDADKTEPGDCGCGATEADADGDGVIDCNDQELNSLCPLDVDSNGVSNDDDGDGIPNCNDNCPNDPNKTEPGDCGCGVTDIDSDNDGILDCNDNEINSPCPLDVDINGISNDDDDDGIANCLDDCDDRIDSDGDGTPDCTDNCENDPNKTEPGDCGCGVAETDTDSDGILDCNDSEINSPCPSDVDANGVSNDDDNDGVPNCDDVCPIGDDNIDSDGDGTPDACDCTSTNSNFNSNTLSGSSSTTLNLSGGTHKDASFTVSELNARTGGKPNRRFVEQVVVSYVNGNGQTLSYGTFRGDAVSSVNVSITGEVQSITVSLSDALGNTDAISVNLGTVNTCVTLDCTDSDGDGICDGDDICPDFNDNLIGTACNDDDPCTINDVYGNDCNCAGTYADSDGDGVCDGDDICPGGDDNIDLDGNGVPDDCDCIGETGSFNPSTLNHSGGGSSDVSFSFVNLSKDVQFSISGLNAKINGNPRNRYEEVVNVTYILASGGSQTLTYSGANTSTANVNIGEYITQVTVSLSNGVSGSSTALSVNLSGINYCAQNPGSSAPSVGLPPEDVIRNTEEIDLKIFPNPANTEINISFASPNNADYSIEVKSILGQRVYKTKGLGSGDKSSSKLDASNWQSGMYFVIINVEKHVFVEKVVIQH